MKITQNKFALPAALLLSAFGIGAANADLTIVSKISASGLPGQAGTPAQTPPPGGQGGQQRQAPPVPKFPLTVTTYYKDSNARTEVAGGPVTIFNATRERTWVLNPADKTYYIKEAAQQRRFGAMNVDAKIDAKKADATDAAATKTIAGAKAQKVALSGTITMSFTPRPQGDNGGPGAPGAGAPPPPGGDNAPPPPGGADPQAAPGGPGGQGGPGGPGGQDGQGGRNRGGFRGFGPVTVDGEVWVSDSVPLPSTAAYLINPLIAQLSFSGQGGRGGNLLQKPILDQLLALKDLPLKSKISVSMVSPRTQEKTTITTTFDVTSVSTASIPDSLFKVPDDYTEVDPPAPAWGGGNRGGGQGGPGGPGGNGGRRNRGGNGGPGGGGPGGPGGDAAAV